jgi:hypothetical protein
MEFQHSARGCLGRLRSVLANSRRRSICEQEAELLVKRGEVFAESTPLVRIHLTQPQADSNGREEPLCVSHMPRQLAKPGKLRPLFWLSRNRESVVGLPQAKTAERSLVVDRRSKTHVTLRGPS